MPTQATYISGMLRRRRIKKKKQRIYVDLAIELAA